MWTYEEKEGLIENATVIYRYKDGVFKMIEIVAHEGYCLHYIYDEEFTDEDGNIIPVHYSYMVSGGTWLDINEYEAVLIEEGMDVAGVPSDKDIA